MAYHHSYSSSNNYNNASISWHKNASNLSSSQCSQVEHGTGSKPQCKSNESVTQIFVGNLNPGTDEEFLEMYFAAFGEVVEVRLMRDPYTGQSRKFAFVEFETREIVDSILQFSPHVIQYYAVNIKRALLPAAGYKPQLTSLLDNTNRIIPNYSSVSLLPNNSANNLLSSKQQRSVCLADVESPDIPELLDLIDDIQQIIEKGNAAKTKVNYTEAITIFQDRLQRLRSSLSERKPASFDKFTQAIWKHRNKFTQVSLKQPSTDKSTQVSENLLAISSKCVKTGSLQLPDDLGSTSSCEWSSTEEYSTATQTDCASIAIGHSATQTVYSSLQTTNKFCQTSTIAITTSDQSSQITPTTSEKSCQYITKMSKEKYTTCNIKPSVDHHAIQCPSQTLNSSINTSDQSLQILPSTKEKACQHSAKSTKDKFTDCNPKLLTESNTLNSTYSFCQVSPLTVDSSLQCLIQKDHSSIATQCGFLQEPSPVAEFSRQSDFSCQAMAETLDSGLQCEMQPAPVEDTTSAAYLQSTRSANYRWSSRRSPSSLLYSTKSSTQYYSLQRAIILNVPSNFNLEAISNSLNLVTNSSRIIKILPSTFADKNNYIILIPSSILKTCLKSGGLLIGHSKFLIRPHTSLVRCRSCQGLGHTHFRCLATPACVNCGQSHTGDSCHNSPSCINCFNHNCNHPHQYQVDHPASDKNCPTYVSQYQHKRNFLNQLFSIQPTLCSPSYCSYSPVYSGMSGFLNSTLV